MERRRTPIGFTVLELLLVVAVLGVLFAVAPLVLPLDRLATNQAVEKFQAELRRARFEAVRRNEPVTFRFTAAGNYVEYLVAGDDIVFSEPLARSVSFDVDLTLDGAALDTLTVQFDPRGVSQLVVGSTPRVGDVVSVEIVHPRGASDTLEVNGYGLVRHN